MMRFQCRSLLAFFMVISASLAKEQSVAELVTTSRHKGRSHKVSASNLLETEDGTPAQIATLSAAKVAIIDSDNNRLLSQNELLESYDDVNAYQSTSTEQTAIFFAAMDGDVTGDGVGTVSPDEHKAFEVTMLTDYDDTFDAIATKRVEFLLVFNAVDTDKNYFLDKDELAKAGVTCTASNFDKADASGSPDGKISFEEIIEDDAAGAGSWLLWDLLAAKTLLTREPFMNLGMSWN